MTRPACADGIESVQIAADASDTIPLPRKRRSGSRRSRLECCPGEVSTGYPIVFCHVTRASITPAAPTTLTLPTHDPVTRAAASLARPPLLYPVATLAPRVFVRPRINISQHFISRSRQRLRSDVQPPSRSGRNPARSPFDQASSIVTVVMATGESGKSRPLRGAAAIASTTSMPVSTWPKRV